MRKLINKRVFSLIVLVCFLSINSSKAIDEYHLDGRSFSIEKLRPNTTYTIDKSINLHDKELYLPEGICFKLIKNKGVFINGTIVGNKTKIEGDGVYFSNVNIKGTWVVPKIRSTMFSNLDYDNSLRDVLALTNPGLHNDVIIEEGNYYISLNKNAETGLLVESDTDIYIKGNIILRPNPFQSYSVIAASGNNINIRGGCVFGDRYMHKGNDGEWGRCITIDGNHVNISNTTIKDAWGDCLYITGGADNVSLSDCLIKNGRRQGISIICASNVKIKNCQIYNISGTDPECAIDIEPNQNDTVLNVVIEKVTVSDCIGGLALNGRAHNSKIGNVRVKNCTFSSMGKPVVIGTTIDKMELVGCRIKQTDGNKVIAFDHVKELIIRNNNFTYDVTTLNYLLGKLKKTINIDSWPMIISDCGIYKFVNNKGL